MSSFFNSFEDAVFSLFNIGIKRKLNGKVIVVPLINGIRLGISGEKWMSGVLTEIFKYATAGVFYDVGINLGQTLTKVMTLDEKRKYIGFEPNPSCVFYVTHLVSLNGWERNITVMPVGLSDVDDLLYLYGDGETDPESTIIKDLTPNAKTVSRLVPVFRHDSIMKNILIDRVSVVKIDVEGAELQVINSLTSLIERDRPVIVMEVLPNSQDNGDKFIMNKRMIETVKGLNYSFYRIVKTSSDAYAGIVKVDNVGDYSDPIMKDHVILPVEQESQIKQMMAMV
jgi:FkbM family methyltransferase